MADDVIFGDDDGPVESGSENQEEQESSQVAGRYRLSPLSLTVFRRETDSGTFFDLNLQRAYTTDGGESYDYTGNLRPRDLRKASRLLERAADDIQGLERTEVNGDD